MSSGSSQTPIQATTQTKDPWAPAAGHLQGTMGAAQGLYLGDTGYQPWTGPTQIDPNSIPDFAAAKTRAEFLANKDPYGTPQIQHAQGLADQMIQGQGINAGLQGLLDQTSGQNNPYLEGVIRQGVDQANAGASGRGRYGSGSHDAAITQAMSPVLAQDYARRQEMQQKIYEGGLQRAGSWAQLTPTLDQAQYANIDRLMAMGDYQRAYEQANLQDQMKIYAAQQARPWEQLSRYNAIVSGAGGLGGNQVTSSPIQQPSTIQKALGGAATGASLGSLFGLPGAAVGGAAGGLLGLL